MKRRLSVLLPIGLAGCTVGGVDFTQPSKAFDLSGNYVLVVQAATVCDLPVTHYEWNVVAVAGTGAGNTAVVTLPGDDRRIHLVFCGTCQADPTDVLADLDTDGPPEGDAPLPDDLSLRADMTLTGKLEAGANGRGEVRNGVAEGTLSLRRKSDEDSDAVGSCLSDVSSWSLSPR